MVLATRDKRLLRGLQLRMQPAQFIGLDFGGGVGLVRLLCRPAINKEDYRLLDRVRLTGDRNYLHRDTPQLLAEAGRGRVGQSRKVLLKRTIERKPQVKAQFGAHDDGEATCKWPGRVQDEPACRWRKVDDVVAFINKHAWWRRALQRLGMSLRCWRIAPASDSTLELANQRP